jgi:hypothetical protein
VCRRILSPLIRLPLLAHTRQGFLPTRLPNRLIASLGSLKFVHLLRFGKDNFSSEFERIEFGREAQKGRFCLGRVGVLDL